MWTYPLVSGSLTSKLGANDPVAGEKCVFLLWLVSTLCCGSAHMSYGSGGDCFIGEVSLLLCRIKPNHNSAAAAWQDQLRAGANTSSRSSWLTRFWWGHMIHGWRLSWNCQNSFIFMLINLFLMRLQSIVGNPSQPWSDLTLRRQIWAAAAFCLFTNFFHIFPSNQQNYFWYSDFLMTFLYKPLSVFTEQVNDFAWLVNCPLSQSKEGKLEIQCTFHLSIHLSIGLCML